MMRLLRPESAVVDPPGLAEPASSAVSHSSVGRTASDAAQQPIAEASLEPPAEQTRYANVLEGGAYAGLLCLFVTFPIYVFGLVEPHTPLERVTQCWGLDAEAYHRETGTEGGWSWLSMLHRGDFLNFVGIVVLAGTTAVCYCAVLPAMLRRKDWIYVVLVVLQVVVFILAASGICAVGH